MTEEVKFHLEVAKEQMEESIKHLEVVLAKIRAGKANPQMLGNVQVDYYGTSTPISQMANVNTPDAQTISIQPWDKSVLQDIEKAIMEANLGFTPMNNGEMIMINIPPLTEERRLELVKQAKAEAEHCKGILFRPSTCLKDDRKYRFADLAIPTQHSACRCEEALTSSLRLRVKFSQVVFDFVW